MRKVCYLLLEHLFIAQLSEIRKSGIVVQCNTVYDAKKISRYLPRNNVLAFKHP